MKLLDSLGTSSICKLIRFFLINKTKKRTHEKSVIWSSSENVISFKTRYIYVHLSFDFLVRLVLLKRAIPRHTKGQSDRITSLMRLAGHRIAWSGFCDWNLWAFYACHNFKLLSRIINAGWNYWKMKMKWAFKGTTEAMRDIHE